MPNKEDVINSLTNWLRKEQRGLTPWCGVYDERHLAEFLFGCLQDLANLNDLNKP
jgi:hypothetical protein